jgi:Na+-driven multidrug efflux pump
MNPRTRLLLEGPITATLLKLAAPNMLVMIVQASIGLIETYFIGMLGTHALPRSRRQPTAQSIAARGLEGH